jgi:hypothetical protein
VIADLLILILACFGGVIVLDMAVEQIAEWMSCASRRKLKKLKSNSR